MGTEPAPQAPAMAALEGVARVARVLVGMAGGMAGLSALGNDALAEVREALELDVAALYLADDTGSRVLRCIGSNTARHSRTSSRQVVSLDEDAWRFMHSGGPLVFREHTAWLMPNPFDPPADHWLVLPLTPAVRVLGAIVGCARDPISLAPLPVARLTVIGDLLSAGAANALLRADLQRNELQRERMRMAEELHDDLAQDLAAAVRELALLEARPAPGVAAASEARLRAAVLDAHRVVRRHLDVLVADLPLAGLRESVEEICNRFRQRGLEIALSDTASDTALEPAVVVVVVRVLNEALANVLAHAGVTRAEVSLTDQGDSVQLVVRDSGRGLRAPDGLQERGHFGLAIMRQRAHAAGGVVEMRGEQGVGTSIELTVPKVLSAG